MNGDLNPNPGFDPSIANAKGIKAGGVAAGSMTVSLAVYVILTKMCKLDTDVALALTTLVIAGWSTGIGYVKRWMNEHKPRDYR